MRKKTKNINIIHRGAIRLHNGESAEPGMAAAVTNLREREQALEVVGDPQQVDQLQPGDKVMLVDGDRTLVLRDNSLLFNNNVILNTTATVIAAHMVGSLLVVVTSDGNVAMRRTTTTYQRVDIEQAIPHVHLAAVELEQLQATIPSYEFASPYSTWQAPLASADVQALAKLLRNALSAAQASAVAQGRFSGVMMARYAVRLWDDSYLWMSQPVMVGHNILKSNYRATATVNIAANQFSGVEAVNVNIGSFRLGITMCSGITAEWRHLVKAIDVLVSPVAAPFIASEIDYRCLVSTASGSRRYLLEVGPKPRSSSAMLATMLKGQWQVVASTTVLDGSAFTAVNTAMSSQQALPSQRCDVVTALLLNAHTVSAHECQQVMNSYQLKPISTVSMQHNGRLYQAPAAFSLSNPWHVLPWIDGTVTAGTVNATVQVTLATSEGIVTLTTSASCPCSATAINPFVAFPDSRATHIVIAVGNRRWETDLAPLDGTGMAVWVNQALAANAMPPGPHPGGDTSSAVIIATGQVLVSAIANPFTTQWRAHVSGASILAMGAACRPIYSGGFGRYPIYLFTTQGIMALPQQVSGNYGEPRLISEAVIAPGAAPVPGADGLWFVDQHLTLCLLMGSSLTHKLTHVDPSTMMAWNDHEQELWMLYMGNVTVLMPSGRTYARNIGIGSLYSDPTHALAVATDGALLDLCNEGSTPSGKSFYYLSQPFSLEPLMHSSVNRITWNVFAPQARGAGAFADVALTMRGERGASCHGYIISHVNAVGIIAAPLSRPVVMPPTRTLRLQAMGTAPCGTLLRPTVLKLISTSS